MGRRYKNPPIVEALCEFEFISSQPWDLTIPGLIYEKVKDEFPDKRQQIGIGVQFKPTEKGLEMQKREKIIEKLNVLESVSGMLNELTTEQIETFEKSVKRRPFFK